ncbi:MAG: ice-binding family protein [Bryobacteraceae bacterium]
MRKFTALLLFVTFSVCLEAQSAVPLGTAGNFVVLAGSGISNTGNSVLTGDLGLSPGSAVSGFPPGIVIGTQHVDDAGAVQAKADLVVAYNNAAGRTGATILPGDIGGQTYGPGVYHTNGGDSLGITGTLHLSGAGVYIFQIGSTLDTAAGNSVVSLESGATAANVFWQVGSSATLGTNTTFNGTILALTSITATTGASVSGRLLARNGAVTLDDNALTLSAGGGPFPPPVPAPSSVILVAIGLACAALYQGRERLLRQLRKI